MSDRPITVRANARPSDLLATPESPAKSPAEIRKHEDAYLDDLLATAAEREAERETLTYYARDPASPTGVKVKVAFAIRVLDAKEITACRAEHVTPARALPNGQVQPEKFDQDGYQQKLIYLATDPEDRKRLWDNPRYKGQVTLPWLLVDRVLKYGERLDAIGKVLDLAGLGSLPEPVLEEAAGNS